MAPKAAIETASGQECAEKSKEGYPLPKATAEEWLNSFCTVNRWDGQKAKARAGIHGGIQWNTWSGAPKGATKEKEKKREKGKDKRAQDRAEKEGFAAGLFVFVFSGCQIVLEEAVKQEVLKCLQQSRIEPSSSLKEIWQTGPLREIKEE